MDPNVALQTLTEACDDGDRYLALEMLDALQGWISKGGFLPTGKV